MEIRRYQEADLDGAIECFLQAIRQTAANDYDPDQILAWGCIDRSIWATRRLSRPTWVAAIDGDVVGFADLESDGHLDMLYVHPRYQRRGTARKLVDTIIHEARSAGLSFVFTEGSLTARPFFEALGFLVVQPERVFRNGQWFDRLRMRIDLNYLENATSEDTRSSPT